LAIEPTPWLKKIDEWRRREEDLPNLSEAIRRLVDAGLEAKKKDRRRGS
jgi:rRNA maturation endonuclease Nob1